MFFLNHYVSRGSSSLGGLTEASSIERTEQSRFHLRTRKEPLKRSGLKKHKGDGKSLKTDPSTVFGLMKDEVNNLGYLYYITRNFVIYIDHRVNWHV
jgi:hypothetical protein